jgi:formate hydrogenlyase transcriptional activator
MNVSESSGESLEDITSLRVIVEETSDQTGERFFEVLVEQIAKSLGARYAFAAEFTASRSRVKTLAFWSDGQLVPNVEYDLAGTPCEVVVAGEMCHFPEDIRIRFPQDEGLKRLGIESYLGVPLKQRKGEVLGHLAAFDSKPMFAAAPQLFMFQVFAARAAAELNRLRMEALVQKSEQQFRDLFDEAPIAYIIEDEESRFQRVNRAGRRLLGLSDQDVPGIRGNTLRVSKVADTHPPSNPQTGDVVKAGLMEIREYRRHDNQKPVWVQCWSRPDPSRKYVRTVMIDITEHVLAEHEQQRLKQQNQNLEDEIKASRDFDYIIGNSPPIRKVLEQVRAVAPTDASVLILGETGTGKELVARAIHGASQRKQMPLIRVNCAALPPSLIESELFGHERGAFTGASARRVGRFELADGGTIFLDEIGELPLEMQSKLLRALQEGQIDPLGSRQPTQVNVRVIAATNRDLRQAIQEKSFREDLFYRLSVFPIDVPPLRDRREDIPQLMHYYTRRFAERMGKKIDRISVETTQLLVDYAWPGNIRELQNLIERAVILSHENLLIISPEMLPRQTEKLPAESPENPTSFPLVDIERQHILAVLQEVGWVIDGARGAALVLGLHPNTLRSRMKKLGIVRPSHD